MRKLYVVAAAAAAVIGSHRRPAGAANGDGE